MKEDNEGICWGNLAKNIGFIFVIIGLIFAIIFLFKGKIYDGIEVAYGFGFVSLGIALIALGISLKSDEKMTTIATSDFLDIAHRFEDLKNFIVGVEVDSEGKIKWSGYWPGTGRSHYTWKCEQLMKRAVELLKWNIAPEYQEQLARFYYNGLVKGLEGKVDTINDPERANFRKMYSHIQKFDVDDKYKEYPSKILDISKNKKENKSKNRKNR